MDAQGSRLTDGVAVLTCRLEERLPRWRRAYMQVARDNTYDESRYPATGGPVTDLDQLRDVYSSSTRTRSTNER
jgi:hypothetical protein